MCCARRAGAELTTSGATSVAPERRRCPVSSNSAVVNCTYADHTKRAAVARISPDITSGNFQSIEESLRIIGTTASRASGSCRRPPGRRPGSSPRRPSATTPCGIPPGGVSLAVFCLHGEPHLDRVAGIDRLHEAQALEPVVGEHRPGRRIHEQAGRRGEDEVAVRDPPLEDRLCGADRRPCARRSGRPRAREVDDVASRDRAAVRDERVADSSSSKYLRNGCTRSVRLAAPLRPLVRTAVSVVGMPWSAVRCM